MVSEIQEKMARQIQAQIELEKFKQAERIKLVVVQFFAALLLCAITGSVVWLLIPSYEEVGEGLSSVVASASREMVNRVAGGVYWDDVFDQNYLPIEFSQTYQSDNIAAHISKAAITRPVIEDLFGDPEQTDDNYLMVTLALQNMDRRKILTFSGNFLTNYFVLQDDVGNTIRGVNLGFTSELLGALQAGYDINPSGTATHDIIFVIPPPKTEYLILSVDMQAFGLDETAFFRIPVDQIAGFGE